jgi:flagellar basal body rod protein FlgF
MVIHIVTISGRQIDYSVHDRGYIFIHKIDGKDSYLLAYQELIRAKRELIADGYCKPFA